MNDPRDARLGALFLQALELPRERRSAFITEASAADASLREELISLVAAHDAAGTYFDDLSERVVAPVLAALGSPSAGGVGSDLAAGLQEGLAGAYRLERELSGGGMSRIFVAEDLRLKRHVVLKVLPSVMVPTASAERFQREIEMAARLQHPHIVPLLSADTVAGVSYYTMPFVTGELLRDRLAREGALEVEDALRIGRDILDGLAQHVSHVLEGSIQKDGPRLRMQVRLVDARDGSTRWSETYTTSALSPHRRPRSAAMAGPGESCRGVASRCESVLKPAWRTRSLSSGARSESVQSVAASRTAVSTRQKAPRSAPYQRYPRPSARPR